MNDILVILKPKYFFAVNRAGCGKIPDLSHCDVNDRVSGGDVACEGQYPWLGLLELRHKTTSAKNQCGASLITLRHLITAGHCVQLHDVEKARLGAHNRSE